MLNVRTILVPTDCTERSRYAVSYATELAHRFSAGLCLLYVIEPDQRLNSDQAKLPLEAFWNTFGCECACQLEVRTGDPCSEIISYALREPVDLIVMNTGRQRSLGIGLSGHITENVTRYSKCPVLCVKETNPPLELPPA